MPRPKASDGGPKPKGSLGPYGFFVQACREEHKRLHPEEQVEFSEFSKKCAERWKTMSDKEKKRFNQMAELDKRRYAMEMATMASMNVANKEEKGKKRQKKPKKVKDPNAPRRSMSAFFWFSKEVRSKVREANPNFSVGEIAKELGRRWSEATPELKSKYEEKADRDRERYNREKEEYQQQSSIKIDLDTSQDSEIEEEDADSD